MTPGAIVIIKEEWRHYYLKQKVPVAGVLEDILPNGQFARVRLHEDAPSLVPIHQLAEVYPGTAAEKRKGDLQLLRAAAVGI